MTLMWEAEQRLSDLAAATLAFLDQPFLGGMIDHCDKAEAHDPHGFGGSCNDYFRCDGIPRGPTRRDVLHRLASEALEYVMSREQL